MKLADQFLSTANEISEAEAAGSEKEIFGENPRFEDVITKIMSRIEKKPKAQQAHFYRQLMDRMLTHLVGQSMSDRKLLQAAKDFWRDGFKPKSAGKEIEQD